MARSIATVYGTALVPGVSRNGRLYTREIIAAAVERAQERIAAGNMNMVDQSTDENVTVEPLTQRTHHAADDDSLRIVGRVTELTLDETTGVAKFAADLADTPDGHTIFALVDTSDGQPAFLRGVSIRGAWTSPTRKVTVAGVPAETADGLELFGLDYTATPGVPGARVERVVPAASQSPKESAGERVLIYESVQEAVVDPTPAEHVNTTETATAAVEPVQEQEPARYADIGYLPDKARRLPLDTPEQARAAWLAVAGTNPTAEGYTEPQRKRVRERAVKALREHGYTIDATEQWLISPPAPVTEALAECWDCEPGSSFYVTLDNGMVCVSVSSYRIDPADLAVVARAAMDGACNTLAGLDPDNDGDVDVDVLDPAETTAAASSVADAVAAMDVMRSAATAATETATETPATTPAADTTHPQEESLVSDETTTTAATEQPAAPAAPTAVTLTNDQFEQLLTAARGAAPAAQAPAAAAETAPAAQAPATEAAPAAAVTETEEQRIERIVNERMTAAVQQVVDKYGPPARKGVSTPLEESGPLNTDTGLPEGWPQKPLEKYTEAERSEYFGQALQAYVLGNRATA